MQMLWIWQWKGSMRQALIERKIKWGKIMMLNMSACNYKSTMSMSFICKQIWLPPLFPTVKGSICVIATLEKMNVTWDFFQAAQGICLPQWSFNWPGHEQPGSAVSSTAVLPNPSSTLLWAGRAVPRQGCAAPSPMQRTAMAVAR